MNKILLCLVVCVLFANLANCLDKNKHCVCRMRPTSRIIGGRQSGKTDFPWMANLRVYVDLTKDEKKIYGPEFKINNQFCGGVIINENWILTSSSCVTLISKFNVGYGNDNDLILQFDAGLANVKRVITHPDHKPLPQDMVSLNDIALVELEKPIEFSKTVLPACLETSSERVDDYGLLMITGFGSTTQVGMGTQGSLIPKISRFLNELYHDDYSRNIEKCITHANLLCTRIASNHIENVCFGDQGVPVHKTINGKTRVVGINSAFDFKPTDDSMQNGIFCTSEAYHTRVNQYIDWIEKTVGSDHC